MNDIDQEIYKCPCCLNFIYDDYECDNHHHICGNCYMKVKKCPLCRNGNVNKSTIINNSERKECKNKSYGCNLSLYIFDNEHELDCLYNEWNCKFCNNNNKNVSFDSIINHFESNCANIFNIINIITYENIKDFEKEGRKYDIQLKPELSLLNIDNQYIIIIVPKTSHVNFIIFSVNNKYRLSNYKIKINNLNEKFINYKRMEDFFLPRENISSNNLIKFTIENLFIINTQTNTYNNDDVTYFESYVVNGEPGSAGNWTKENYDEMYNKFINIFKK